MPALEDDGEGAMTNEVLRVVLVIPDDFHVVFVSRLVLVELYLSLALNAASPSAKPPLLPVVAAPTRLFSSTTTPPALIHQ